MTPAALTMLTARAAWLGIAAAALPSCGPQTSRAPTSRAPAAQAATAQAPARQAPTPPAPTRHAAEQLLTELDATFNRAAADDYARLFAPVPRPGQHSLEMRGMVGHAGKLAQSSTVIDFWQLGANGVIWASTSLATTATSAVGAGTHIEADSVLVFRDDGSGPKVVLYEEIAPGSPQHHAVRGVYRCPPCNFSIGADTLGDWIVVPSPKEVSGCIEMVSFFRPGEDIQLTLSIHHNDAHESAVARLRQLLGCARPELGQWRGTPTVDSWTPPRYAGAQIVQGARCAMDLLDGQRQSLHLLTQQGALAERSTGEPNTAESPRQSAIFYLLTVRGSARNHAAFMADIDTWLDSFQLLDPARVSARVGREAALAHGGKGVMDEDGGYRSEQYHLSFRGPDGWRGAPRADHCLFGATYLCPMGRGELAIAVHAAMPGSVEARQEEAFRMVHECLEQDLELRIVHDSRWRSPGEGEPDALALCDLEARGSDATERRLARLLIYPDLLVVVDGTVRGSDAEAAFRELANSVRR